MCGRTSLKIFGVMWTVFGKCITVPVMQFWRVKFYLKIRLIGTTNAQFGNVIGDMLV